jgi:hypothetical protein
MTKARIICFLFSVAPLALAFAVFALRTRTGGMNDGGWG